MSTKHGKKDAAVKHRGTARRMPSAAYPKKYHVEVDLNPEDGRIVISRRCENMSSWELYGLLHMLLKDIERQMLIKPDEHVKRDGDELA